MGIRESDKVTGQNLGEHLKSGRRLEMISQVPGVGSGEQLADGGRGPLISGFFKVMG